MMFLIPYVLLYLCGVPIVIVGSCYYFIFGFLFLNAIDFYSDVPYSPLYGDVVVHRADRQHLVVLLAYSLLGLISAFSGI